MKLKKKKIAFYIGLPHHAKYLFPLAETAGKMGAEILFITSTDLYPFEAEFMKRGYRFKFVSEYADEETILRLRRSTNKFCDEWTRFCFGWDGIRHWPFYRQDYLFMLRTEEYVCVERMAEVEKPDMFVTLHELNPWGKEIGHVSAKYGIPFVTLQEGDYYVDSLVLCFHTEYSTANLLWGESTVQHLEKFKCSADKMVITGNSHLDGIIKAYSRSYAIATVRNELGIKPGKKVLAFLLGIDWAVVTDRGIWQKICAGLDREELVCVFKWHGLLPVEEFKQIAALIKGIMPSAIVLYTYDPYKILSVADYCVVLGRTTLAIEALAWQKPLFEIPGQSETESYYEKSGVAQLISPLGNWEKLFCTMEKGLPEEIRNNVERYVRRSFYKLDGKTLDRALDVISFILETKEARGKRQEAKGKGQDTVSGRISFIVPSGNDAEALLSTLTSLSQGVAFHDWQAVIVVNDTAIKETLAGISGDLKIVDSESDNLSHLYNKGAEASSGEFLVFMMPGVVYLKGEGFAEAMEKGVAGISVRNADMTPHCLGIGFDFNSTPYFIKEDSSPSVKYEAVGGGIIGISREAFIAIGGFDEDLANNLLEPDICMAAKDKGYLITYLPGCLAAVYKEPAFDKRRSGTMLYADDAEWKSRVKFFAKWCGKLPKDDDVIKYLGDRLKV